MGKDVTGTYLKILMKRDSYRMTRLHRAAYYGNTKAVEEMLGTIRRNLTHPEHKSVADKVINEVIARDEYGFTPFYVAAVRGQEEICYKMLTFLKQVLPGDILEKYWTDTNGFVRRGLSDSIDSENIQMLQLILIVVKKVLGQKELIRVISFHRWSNSVFVECKTKKLFNAMATIVVMGDDNVKDYTDLYDLVFHNHDTLESLKYIDVENLQGLLLQKGVDNFTRRHQDNVRLTHIVVPLLSSQLLEHFTKNQLEQFVETIISKNNFKKIGGISPGIVESVDLNDPTKVESITCNFTNMGWNREDLEFHDDGNGFTSIFIKERLVPRNSYWRDFIISAARANFSHSEDGFGYLDGVFRIFDCLKRVNDSFRKKLLLHEDDNGFIVICLSLDVVKRMLTHLSKESQEEVKQQWKDNAPSIETFFSSTKEQPNNHEIMHTARRWTNVLRFYLEYGSEVQLEEFAKTITFLRNIGVERRSVWSYIFEHCHKEEKIKEILKLVSAKADILGQDSVQTMLFHKMNEIPLLFKAVLWGQDIEAWLEILPKEIREEIQQFMKINAPEFARVN
jgi:hypothetical protein